jgi:SAM-dependent methyltransferase
MIYEKIKRKLSDKIRTIFSKKPRRVPKEYFDRFTLNNTIPVIYKFRDDEYSPKKPPIFSKEYISALKEKALRKEEWYYGETDKFLFQALEKYKEYIFNKEGLDVGSITGWYSTIVLAYGAKKSSILEYNPLISEDDQIEILDLKKFWKNPKKFDFITSISSFEHDGLGRYGDPIDPHADLKIMEKMKKILKQNGIMFLSVPIGKDALVWNLHRIYGKIRFPLLIKGWRLVDSFGFKESYFNRDYKNFIQPVFVLKK